MHIHSTSKYYKLNSHKELLLLKYEDILYIEADGSYSKFHLTNGKIVAATQNLSQIEKALPSFFFRSHRSFCVNINHIVRIDKQRYKVELSNAFSISISKQKIQDLIYTI